MEINENTSPFTGDVRDCKHGGNQSRDAISSVWGTCNTPRHVPKESDSTLIQADLRPAVPARGAGGFFQTIDGT